MTFFLENFTTRFTFETITDGIGFTEVLKTGELGMQADFTVEEAHATWKRLISEGCKRVN
jgi:hypothetical protein